MSSITAQQLDAEKINSVLVRGDRLYVLYLKEALPTAAVFDVLTGELLYEGQAAFNGKEAESSNHLKELSLRNMNLRPL